MEAPHHVSQDRRPPSPLLWLLLVLMQAALGCSKPPPPQAAAGLQISVKDVDGSDEDEKKTTKVTVVGKTATIEHVNGSTTKVENLRDGETLVVEAPGPVEIVDGQGNPIPQATSATSQPATPATTGTQTATSTPSTAVTTKPNTATTSTPTVATATNPTPSNTSLTGTGTGTGSGTTTGGSTFNGIPVDFTTGSSSPSTTSNGLPLTDTVSQGAPTQLTSTGGSSTDFAPQTLPVGS